jgi:AhpD family alkylhydroperoxidase
MITTLRTPKTMLLLLAAGFVPATAIAAPGHAAQAGSAAAQADIKKTLGFVPQFFLKLPELALPGFWDEMKGLQLNPSTALPGKVKELIGLAVAAQIPCAFCIVAHTEFAKLNGATDAEITEAIAMGAYTRNASTLLNGLEIDEPQFRRDIDRLVKGAHAAADKPRVHTAAR